MDERIARPRAPYPQVALGTGVLPCQLPVLLGFVAYVLVHDRLHLVGFRVVDGLRLDGPVYIVERLLSIWDRQEGVRDGVVAVTHVVVGSSSIARVPSAMASSGCGVGATLWAWEAAYGTVGVCRSGCGQSSRFECCFYCDEVVEERQKFVSHPSCLAFLYLAVQK